MTTDRWVRISELSHMFGISEESLGRLAKSHGFPLRRLSPYALPGVLESELFAWLKAQPTIGAPIRKTKKRIEHRPRKRH